ncbi:zinc finger CCCH domain-containing protein 38 [Dorcoceras hygrometricum]|uniref:Zinc finger CCCH domain-containing protein 38 n=1 Tax=Dorcoceras hygrometricum TaxID=472368 RepID=A0A2Z7BSV2_9LAMI|nr:zinc finger CCCH domain-containing protein 38 [Dorcoceras hygrometricum]
MTSRAHRSTTCSPATYKTSETEAQKTAAGSYELHQRYHTSLTQQKALNKLKAQLTSFKQMSESTIQTKRLSKRSPTYHSHSRWRCLPSAIEEDKISTNSNDVAENYCRNWTRNPLLTAEKLTNICSQRNNRSLTQLKLTQLTAESSSLIQNAVVPTNPNDDVEAPATRTR